MHSNTFRSIFRRSPQRYTTYLEYGYWFDSVRTIDLVQKWIYKVAEHC